MGDDPGVSLIQGYIAQTKLRYLISDLYSQFHVTRKESEGGFVRSPLLGHSVVTWLMGHINTNVAARGTKGKKGELLNPKKLP